MYMLHPYYDLERENKEQELQPVLFPSLELNNMKSHSETYE